MLQVTSKLEVSYSYEAALKFSSLIQNEGWFRNWLILFEVSTNSQTEMNHPQNDLVFAITDKH